MIITPINSAVYSKRYAPVSAIIKEGNHYRRLQGNAISHTKGGLGPPPVHRAALLRKRRHFSESLCCAARVHRTGVQDDVL